MKSTDTFKKILFYGSLCIIVVAGLILRLIAIQEKPFWIDEAWTLYFAHTYSYQKLLLVAPVPNDIHLGLYYAIIKTLLKSTTSIEALRIISSMLPQAIALLLFLAWGMHRKISAVTLLMATGIVSFSPFLIHYGWQIRMYSLTLLWVSCMSMLTIDFLIYRSSWRSLYALLPFIILSHVTDINGYLFTASVWLLIFIFKRHSRQFVLWTICVGIASIATLLPYYPFQTAQVFHRASWLSPPSLVYALRAFPLTILGLDTALFPCDTVVLGWPLIIAIGIILTTVFLACWFLLRIPKKVHQMSTLIIVLTLLVPVGGYLFSHISPLATYVPFIYRFIPPISIFLPRFFAPQALLLHVWLAVCLSYCIKWGEFSIRATAMSVVIAIVIVWIYTHQVINITSPDEKLASHKMIDIIKKKDPTNSIFYPGYISLFLFHPSSMLSPGAVATIFTNSNVFEGFIKTNAEKNYCALTKQRGPFTLYESTNIPSFFSPYKYHLNQFTNQFCISVPKNDNDINVYTCQCPLKSN